MVVTEIWAHRGASGWDRQYAPENTMPAFKKAVEMGADGIEFDVHLTKDGEILICHDERIDRTSRGRGFIKNFTLEELKRVDFSKPHVEYGFTPPPTLREFFEFASPLDIKVNIELKTGVIYYDNLEEKVFRMTQEYGMENRVIFSSFNHYSLQKLKSKFPEAKIGLLMPGDTVNIPNDTDMMDAIAVHPPENIVTREYVEKCHAHNIRVHTWTVDNPQRMKELIEFGVDAIITDCPDNGRRILMEMSKK